MDDIESIERAGWDALCAGTGAEFYGRLMTGDGVMVLAHGQALDRDAVVASLEQAPRWTSYSLSAFRTVELGPDCVAVVYEGRAERPDTELAALMTSCYVRREGAWRLAVYQQTVIP